MRETIAEPRSEVSDYAPRVEVIQIPTDKIGLLIVPAARRQRPAGRVRREHLVENDGTVFVAGVDGVSVKAALSAINGMTKDVESGDIYTGKVVKTTNFGAFVELMPGGRPDPHLRLAPGKQRVERVEDVVSEGDRVKVRVLDIDKQNRISLEKLEE